MLIFRTVSTESSDDLLLSALNEATEAGQSGATSTGLAPLPFAAVAPAVQGLSATADTTAAALGFALRLEAGKAILELRDRALGGGLHLERLEMEIPNVRFPFDVSGGAERFRSQRCDLRTLVLKISNETLAKWLHRPQLAEAGFRELELVHDEGSLFCSGRLEHGVNDVRFCFRFAPIILTPRSLLLFFFDERVFGTLDLPAARIPLLMLQHLDLLPQNAESPSYDVIALATRRLLPAHGWKIPNTNDVGLVSAEAAKSGLVAACGVNLVTQHATNMKVSLAFDQRAAFESAEAAIYRGEESEAWGLLKKAMQHEIVPPFAVRRLLHLAAANEAWFEEGRSIAEETLANDPSDADANHYLAQLAQREGDLNEGARRYALSAEQAWTRGDERTAALLDVSAAELARHGLRELSRTCLDRTLQRRRHDPRALQLAFELAIEDQRHVEAAELGERLLRVLPEAERFDVHLGLGRLFLGRDRKKAKIHAERALRGNMESERALRLVADVYADQGDTARALRTYSRLAERAAQTNSTADMLSLELKIVSLIEASGEEHPRALLTRLQRIMDLMHQPNARTPDMALRRKEAMQRAAAIAFSLGERSLARRYYEELLHQASTTAPDQRLVAEGNFALGAIALQEARSLEAEVYFENAATSEQGHEEAYRALLNIYETRNDLRAQYRLEDLLANHIKDEARAVAHHLRAANVALRLSDMQSCLDHLNAGLQIAPDHRLLKQRLFEVLSDMAPSPQKAQLLARWARIEHEPEMRSEWFVALAGVLEGLGQEPQAKEALKEAVKADAGALEANEALYALCQRLNDHYGAFEALGNIARYRPASDESKAELRINQAELLAGPLQRRDEARAYLLRALVDAPHHVRGLWLLAGLSEEANDLDTAMPAYERYLETGDKEHRLFALDKVANWAIEQNQLQKAYELLRTLWRESQQASVLNRLVAVLKQRGDFATVTDILRDAAREADEKHREELIWQTAQMLRDSVGDWAAARRELEQIADNPSEVGQRARVALIELAQEEGRTELVAPALERALPFATNQEERMHLLLSLARARRELSEQALAAEAYEQVLAIDPDDTEALAYIADYSLELGDREESFRYWLRVGRLEPDAAWERLSTLIDLVDAQELLALVDPPWPMPRNVADTLANRFLTEQQPEHAVTALEHCIVSDDDRAELELSILNIEENDMQRPDLALARIERLRMAADQAYPELEEVFERLVAKAGSELMQAELALRHATHAVDLMDALARILALEPLHTEANQRLVEWAQTDTDHALLIAWLSEQPDERMSSDSWLATLQALRSFDQLHGANKERLARRLRAHEQVKESNPLFAELWLEEPQSLQRLEEWLEGIAPESSISELLYLSKGSQEAQKALVSFIDSGDLQSSFGVDLAMELASQLQQNAPDIELPSSVRENLARWLAERDPDRAQQLWRTLAAEAPTPERLELGYQNMSGSALVAAMAAQPIDEALLQSALDLPDHARALRAAWLRRIDEQSPLSLEQRLVLARDARVLGADESARAQFARIYRERMDQESLIEWLLSEPAPLGTAQQVLDEAADPNAKRAILAQLLQTSGVLDNEAKLQLRHEAAEAGLLDSNELFSLAQDEAMAGHTERAHKRLEPLVADHPNDSLLVDLWRQTAGNAGDSKRLARHLYEWRREQLRSRGTEQQLAEQLAQAVSEGLFEDKMASEVRSAFVAAGSLGRALEWAKKATAERPSDVREWLERCRIALALDDSKEVLAACDELATIETMDGEALVDFRARRAEELRQAGHEEPAAKLFVKVLEADPTHVAAFAALQELLSDKPAELLNLARRRALFQNDDPAALTTYYELARRVNNASDEQQALLALLRLERPSEHVQVGMLLHVLQGEEDTELGDDFILALISDARSVMTQATEVDRRALAHAWRGLDRDDTRPLAYALLASLDEISDADLVWMVRHDLAAGDPERALHVLQDRRPNLVDASSELLRLWLETATLAKNEAARSSAVAALGKREDATLDVKLDLVRIHRQRGDDEAATELVFELLQPTIRTQLNELQLQGLLTAERELLQKRIAAAMEIDPDSALEDAEYLLASYPESSEIQRLALTAAQSTKDDEKVLAILAKLDSTPSRRLLQASTLQALGRIDEATDLRLQLLDDSKQDPFELPIGRNELLAQTLAPLSGHALLKLRQRFDAELDEPADERWRKSLALADQVNDTETAHRLAEQLFESAPKSVEYRDRMLAQVGSDPNAADRLAIYKAYLLAHDHPAAEALQLIRGLSSEHAEQARALLAHVVDSLPDAETIKEEVHALRLELATAAGDHERAYALLSESVAAATDDQRIAILESLESLAKQLGNREFAAMHFADALTAAPTLDRYARLRDYEDDLTGLRDVVPLLLLGEPLLDGDAKATLHEKVGGILEQRGELSPALAHFQKASELRPDDSTLSAHVARLHEETGDVHGLVDHLARQHSTSLDRAERYSLAMRVASLCQAQLQDPTQAELFLRQAAKDAPDSRAPHDALLVLYQARQADEQVASTLETLITMTDSGQERAELAHRLGDLRLSVNDLQGAAAAYLYVLNEGVSTPGLRQIVTAQAKVGVHTAETLAALTKIAERGELEERAPAFWDCATISAERGDYARACAYAERSFEIAAPTASSLSQTVEWAQRSGQNDVALRLIDRMIDQTKDKAEIIALHRQRSDTARSLGRQDLVLDAELELFRLSALSPDEAVALASALARAGQHDESRFVAKAIDRSGLSPKAKKAFKALLLQQNELELVVQLLLATEPDPLERGAALCEAARLCIEQLGDPDRGYKVYLEALNEGVALSEEDLSAIMALAESRSDDETLTAIYLRVAESEGPKDKRAQAYAAMARFWQQRGETQRSEDCLRAALKLTPDDVAMKRVLADLLLADNRLEDAAPLLTTLDPPEDATPERRAAWLKVAAESAFRANDDTKGLAILERAALEDEEALGRAYDLRERRGEKQVALTLMLDRLGRANPERVEVARWQRAARLAVELRDGDGELVLLKQLAAQAGLDGLGMARLAALYELRGDNAQAIEWIKRRTAAQSGVEKAGALLQATKLAIEINDREQARTLLRQAFDEAPSHIATLEALYDGSIRIGDKEQALVVGERLVLLAPKHSVRDDFHMTLAEIAAEVGDNRRAVDLYGLSAERKPLSSEQLDRAVRLADAVGGDLAAEWREKAITLRGGSAEEFARLAKEAHERGDIKRAEKLLERAQQLSPNDEGLLRQLVELRLADRTMLPEAIRLYRELLERNPLEVEAWRTLARLFGQNNDVDRTFAAYDALLALSPDDPEATQFVSAARTMLPELPTRALLPQELAELAESDLLTPLQTFYSPLSAQAELLYPTDLARLGLSEQNRINKDQGFGRRLQLIQQLMGGRASEIAAYQSTVASLDAVVEPGAPPKLVLGAEVPTAPNKLAQFVVARTLAILSLGHLLPSRLPRPDMTTLLMLLQRRFLVDVTVEGLQPERIEAFLARFRIVTPDDVWAPHAAAAEQLRRFVPAAELSHAISRWSTAADQAADRWALLIGGELQAAFSAPKLVGAELKPAPTGANRLKMISERPDLLALLRFAATEKYTNLRAAIGLTVRR